MRRTVFRYRAFKTVANFPRSVSQQIQFKVRDIKKHSRVILCDLRALVSTCNKCLCSWQHNQTKQKYGFYRRVASKDPNLFKKICKTKSEQITKEQLNQVEDVWSSWTAPCLVNSKHGALPQIWWWRGGKTCDLGNVRISSDVLNEQQ